jgi:predicted MFS family arabinose efflux permease
VFAVSFALALIGVATIVTFVQNVQPGGEVAPLRSPSLRDATRLFLDRRLRALVIAAAALGVVTLSDGFLYLVLQRRLQFPETFIPLLFVVTPALYMVLAAPVGRLADRRGRPTVVLAGYVLLAAVYLIALYGPPGWVTLAVCVSLLAAFYAATDGVLMALASAGVPPALRATGLGTITTANGLARVVSSVGFGWLWSRGALQTALAVYAAGLLLAVLLARRAFRDLEVEARHG